MAWRFLWFQRLRRAPSALLLHFSRPTLPLYSPKSAVLDNLNRSNSFEYCNRWIISRDLSSGLVNLVISDGKPKFEVQERDPPKKHKWKTKKRLKMQRKKEKRKRREANKRDPRCIRPKGQKQKKQKFATAEDRIKYKIEKAKLKEALLVEKLKKYKVNRVQGPIPNPKEEQLTGEERFFMKKMAQKRSNYVPIGRRGIFGGVVLNMHLHWKKHETVRVVCKPCKPGQVHEYAQDLARLSGGLPIQIIGNDTIIFYRGKNYVQPEVMSPVDTLSKKRALEKSKYEQSLDTVRRFIAIAEKELELYYRHMALYGDPRTRNSDFVYGGERRNVPKMAKIRSGLLAERNAPLSEPLDEDFSTSEADSEDSCLAGIGVDSDYEDVAGTEADSDDEWPSRFEVGSHDGFGEEGRQG